MVMQSANVLGAPHYTFHGTARMKRAARLPNADNFPRMIEGFAGILEVWLPDGYLVGPCSSPKGPLRSVTVLAT